MLRPRRDALVAAIALAALAGCGRSSLPIDHDARGTAGGGPTSTSASVGVGAGGSGPACKLADLSTWKTERYRDDGDYERAAVAVSGAPWIALKPKGAAVEIDSLSIDPAQGIVRSSRIDVPGAAVYPVAVDVDDTRVVLVTTSGINWNGDLTLWQIDRQTSQMTHVALGPAPADPSYTLSAAVAIVGSDLVVAHAVLASGVGSVELRDTKLALEAKLDVSAASFTAVRTSPAAVDVYSDASAVVHATGGTLSAAKVDPSWHVLGGLDDYLVEGAFQARMKRGTDVWAAAWPDTQYSPPVIVRTGAGSAAFILEGELTPFLGYPANGALEWLKIEPAPGAPGFGLGLLPVVTEERLGMFYLGVEIPSPLQPLRYFGKVCR